MIFNISRIQIYSALLLIALSLVPMPYLGAMSSQTNQLLAHVFESAPEELKLFALQVQSQDQAHPTYFINRVLFLVGKTGIGKTTLAKALLYAINGSAQSVFTSCGSVHTSGQTSQHDSSTKKVLVFDNIDSIYESQSDHESSALAHILSQFDAQQDNHNLFIIGTLQNITHAPESLKTRVLGNTVWLQEPSMQEKVTTLRFLLSTLHQQQLANDCDDQFLETECISRIGAQTYRDLEAIVAKILYWHRKNSQTTHHATPISSETMRRAITQLATEKEKMSHAVSANKYGLSAAEIDEAKRVVIAAQTTQTSDIDEFTLELSGAVLSPNQRLYVLDLLKEKKSYHDAIKKEQRSKKVGWFSTN